MGDSTRLSVLSSLGSPGSGKTALIRHIALQLESELLYQIVPISKPEDILNYGDLNRPQIFVIDDVLGVFDLERNLLSDLERHSEQIENVLDKESKRSKLFMSCRLAVYNEAKELDVVFFEVDNILNLDSKEHRLTTEDRKGILETHFKIAGISYAIDSILLQEKGVLMFPLLCQVFSSDKRIREYGIEFFKYPNKCWISDIDKIQKRNKLQYLSMVLCMLYNNGLSDKMLTNKRMLENVCRSCKVEGTPQNWEIFEKLSHLKGTYITESDKKYTFIHDSIFEVVAYHYGQQFPDQILEHMSSNFIAKRVVLKNTKTGNDICITLNKSYYEHLAKRLYADVKRGKLHDVFLNKALRDFDFKQQFLNLLTKAPYEDVKTSFLLPREECFKSIILDSKIQSKKGDQDTIGQRELDRQNLLLDLKCIGRKKIYGIRAISFIIYYGHFDLLKFFYRFGG
ncbi:uncharacterized protein LOC133189261 [Saccostrea echinata]|uniref:uncharacterized protein LOC133189261 n=1 Tax=Saccostrea echinata TaxID=191078 RepID=UPI002A83C6CF|nr:uncharacterized protein LOC133189261 [Saccostrea echinata]